MAEVVVPLIDVFIVLISTLIVAVVWRALWLHTERKRLAETPSSHHAERFDPEPQDDEYDKTYSGRVISRMRARQTEGRLEIHWEFHPKYVHRGFVLSGKCRRGDGAWEPLPMEPHEDSSSYIEGFDYGDTRDYIFSVKKKYWFFFGLFGEAPHEILYDQISFTVRKGKFIKERSRLMRDRTELAEEVANYGAAVKKARKAVQQMNAPDPAPRIPETPVERLKQRIKSKRHLADELEKEIAAVNAHPTWSEKRKEEEIEALERAFEEMEMRE